MGGIGSTSNVAVDMVDEQRPYKAIVLPFGLFRSSQHAQARSDEGRVRSRARDRVQREPDSLHRRARQHEHRATFITDLRNGELSRDLNDYRGSRRPPASSAEGLASPNWGYTFKLRKSPNGPFQGIYAGAGMYFSMKTAAEMNRRWPRCSRARRRSTFRTPASTCRTTRKASSPWRSPAGIAAGSRGPGGCRRSGGNPALEGCTSARTSTISAASPTSSSSPGQARHQRPGNADA